ncbi:GNAT family N-acetyltransferase [Hydrogenophaga sp. OTU3427]|uniref:GNAT family N-acetyltransferase n=1 Tax=Hydrogenophaga sp. OTU3427 TaxID=3043856 RepID=UPI00313C5118
MSKFFQFIAERLSAIKAGPAVPDAAPGGARPWDTEGRYDDKIISAGSAVQLIPPGSHVFVGTACATPRTLVQALEQFPHKAPDLELVHFFTDGMVPHDAEGRATTRYRHRSFFVGADIRAAVRAGQAEYLPISIARVPELIGVGRIPVDVALIQVSPPDRFGYVSLGVSVDVVAAAVQKAKLVIAEVNPHMPWTLGDSAIHMDQIDHLVPVDTPMIEFHHQFAPEVVERIARYIAGIIEDGSTLQIGLGRIPNEALKYLDDRKDLGIHSDVITDAIIPLLERGILTGRNKSQQRGKIVTSFAMGTRKLYDIIERNPLFSFQPIDVVCDPFTIAAQKQMVSVTQAFAIDLTGQVCSDQFQGEFYSGIAAQGEFLRGASRSPGGKAIICMASTTDDGEVSRIRPMLLEGEGVTVPRSEVHFVITEYGVAYLFGKGMRERAIALIQLAHPKFRQGLLDEARRLGYLPADQTLQNLRAYEVEAERHVTLKDGRQVLLRPSRAADAEGLRDLFFKLPPDDIFTRFFRRVHAPTHQDIERLCNFSNENEVGFVAVTGPREQEVIVGQACYFNNVRTNLADTAFMVDPRWQGSGLGSAMQQRLMEHAQARGVQGFVADILPQNAKMIALARRGSDKVTVERDEDSVHVTVLF